MAAPKSKKPSKKSQIAISSAVDMDATYDEISKDLAKIGSPGSIGDREECIESRSVAMDYALGGWGIPRGRFSMISGPPDSGKTTTLMLYGISAVQAGLKVAIINREGRWNTKYAELSGMGKPNKDYLLLYPDSAESSVEAIRKLAVYGFDYCGLESIAALAPAAEISGDFRDANIGVLARIMSKFFRDAVLEVAASNMAVFMTNQLRDKIGVMYGSPETAPGGHAKDYFATVDIKLNTADRDYLVQTKTDKFETTGMTIKGYTKKSVGVNRRKVACTVQFLNGLSVDEAGEALDFGMRLNIFRLKDGSPKLGKAGGWVYAGKSLGNSEKEAKIFLTENTDIMDEIREGIREVVRTGKIILEKSKDEQSDGQPEEEA